MGRCKSLIETKIVTVLRCTYAPGILGDLACLEIERECATHMTYRKTIQQIPKARTNNVEQSWAEPPVTGICHVMQSSRSESAFRGISLGVLIPGISTSQCRGRTCRKRIIGVHETSALVWHSWKSQIRTVDERMGGWALYACRERQVGVLAISPLLLELAVPALVDGVEDNVRVLLEDSADEEDLDVVLDIDQLGVVHA